MRTVQFEHAINDFAIWKAAFDRDPIGRQGRGVRRHRIARPLDDPNYVIGELVFGRAAEAQAFQVALRGLWSSAAAAPALVGTPRVRIVETVEEHDYELELSHEV